MSSANPPLTTADAITLLDLLTTDHEFRLAFQANPALALQRISPEAAASALGCTMPGSLASTEALAASREELSGHLTTNSVFSVPFCLVDHGNPSSP